MAQEVGVGQGVLGSGPGAVLNFSYEGLQEQVRALTAENRRLRDRYRQLIGRAEEAEERLKAVTKLGLGVTVEDDLGCYQRVFRAELRADSRGYDDRYWLYYLTALSQGIAEGLVNSLAADDGVLEPVAREHQPGIVENYPRHQKG